MSQQTCEGPARVQAVGALLVFDPETWEATHSSPNLVSFLPGIADLDTVPDIRNLFDPDLVRELTASVKKASGPHTWALLGQFNLGDVACNLGFFRNGTCAGLEIEQVREGSLLPGEVPDLIADLVSDLEHCVSEEHLCDTAVDRLRRISGFAKVNLHRFGHLEKDQMHLHGENRKTDGPPVSANRALRRDLATCPPASPVLALRGANDITLRPFSGHRNAWPDLSLAALAKQQEPRALQGFVPDPCASMTLTVEIARMPWGVFEFCSEETRIPGQPLRQVLHAFAVFMSNHLHKMHQQAEPDRKGARTSDEANHKAGNIFSLVEAEPGQTHAYAAQKDRCARELDARVRSRIKTRGSGSVAAASPVAFSRILQTAARDYVEDTPRNIQTNGPDRTVQANHAPVVSVILQEMFANSARHGALSRPEGMVRISTQEEHDGFVVDWQEHGGPLVTPPNTPGSGTTLIKHALAHMLGGQSELVFASDGLRAKLRFPETVFEGNDRRVATNRNSSPGPVQSPRSNHDHARYVLLLEDNFLVAADMTDSLATAGFPDIRSATNVASAKAVLELALPLMAVLDVNLGAREDSYEIARILARRSVPFLFVTGYGDRLILPADIAPVCVMSKPVNRTQLAIRIAETVKSRDAERDQTAAQ